MAKVTMEVDAETAKAVREIGLFVQQQKAMERANREAARAAREHGKAADEQSRSTAGANAAMATMLGHLRQFAPGLVRLAAVGTVVATLKKQFEDLNNVIRKRAEAQIEFGGTEALKDLVQKFPDQAAEAKRLALRVGARQGVLPEPAAATMGRFAGLAERQGDLEGTARDAEEAMRLQFLGVEGRTSVDFLSEFIKKQRTAAEGSAALLAAADRTPLGVRDFSAALGGIREFERPEVGVGIAAQLSQFTTEPAELEGLTKKIGETLNRESPFVKTMQQMLDADRMRTEGARLGTISSELGLKSPFEAKELLERMDQAGARGVSERFGPSAADLDQLGKLELARTLFPEVRTGDVETIRTSLEEAGVASRELKGFAALLSDVNWAGLAETIALMNDAMAGVSQAAGGITPAEMRIREVTAADPAVMFARARAQMAASKAALEQMDPEALTKELNTILQTKRVPKGSPLASIPGLLPTDERGLLTPRGELTANIILGKPDDTRPMSERLDEAVQNAIAGAESATLAPGGGPTVGEQASKAGQAQTDVILDRIFGPRGIQDERTPISPFADPFSGFGSFQGETNLTPPDPEAARRAGDALNPVTYINRAASSRAGRAFLRPGAKTPDDATDDLSHVQPREPAMDLNEAFKLGTGAAVSTPFGRKMLASAVGRRIHPMMQSMFTFESAGQALNRPFTDEGDDYLPPFYRSPLATEGVVDAYRGRNPEVSLADRDVIEANTKALQENTAAMRSDTTRVRGPRSAGTGALPE